MNTIKRQSLLYKTGVEYGDYTINHILGCAHGCLYPCYAFMMARRFGRVKGYEDWLQPRLVANALSLLKSELPRLKEKIKSVHLCFTSDPFMVGFPEVTVMSMQILDYLDREKVKSSVLTKGTLPKALSELSKQHEWGISLISLNEDFRSRIEPNTASYEERISSLRFLHDQGCRTWVSIEPYPTPNIVSQDLRSILSEVSFVDRIVFGRLHYNGAVTQYSGYQQFFNDESAKVVEFCTEKGIGYHIKTKTVMK
jgi:DNA repair photolyase